jgi:hypothetical protein
MNVAAYNQAWMKQFIEIAKERNKKVFITFHDGCQWKSNFPYNLVDKGIIHSESIRKHIPMPVEIVTMGVHDFPVQITSFGLGRNQVDQIQITCEELGFKLLISNHNQWKTLEEIVLFIRQGDGVVLWYPPTDVAGESSCARLALSARRPLFLHRSTWFLGLIDVKDVYFFKDRKDLQKQLEEYYSNNYISTNSWNSIAKIHERLYS